MRRRAGLTQAQLGGATGVTQAAISNLENGTRPLTLEWMRAFARVLDCAVADLLDDADNPERLAEDEKELVDRYRYSSEQERETIQKVSAAVSSYRPPAAEDEAA